MTFDQWFYDCLTFFEKHRVPVFIHGSTLLNAVRGKGLALRHGFDRELNFGIRARDLSQQLIWEMEKEFPYVLAEGSRLKNALIYFGPRPIIEYHAKNESQWDMKPGFALLATFWEGKESWYEYMGYDIVLEWPKAQLETFSSVNISGKTVSTPRNYHEWLSHYFGEDYEIENLDWHWIKDAHNRKDFNELRKRGEI